MRRRNNHLSYGDLHSPTLDSPNLRYTSHVSLRKRWWSRHPMRNFQILDGCKADPESDSLELYHTGADSEQPMVALHREGAYVTISASYGPLEVALRPRYEDLVRTLSRL